MNGAIQIDSLLLHIGAGLIIASAALYVGLVLALLVGGVIAILLAEFVWVDQVKQFSVPLRRKNKVVTRKERRHQRLVEKQLAAHFDDTQAAIRTTNEGHEST
jgi:hypothetical protein